MVGEPLSCERWPGGALSVDGVVQIGGILPPVSVKHLSLDLGLSEVLVVGGLLLGGFLGGEHLFEHLSGKIATIIIENFIADGCISKSDRLARL